MDHKSLEKLDKLVKFSGKNKSFMVRRAIENLLPIVEEEYQQGIEKQKLEIKQEIKRLEQSLELLM